MSTAIKTENLTKLFGSVTALNGVNIEVPEGSIYALVGPNGAGKTTAIKILMNIIRPTRGRAEVMQIPSQELMGRAFASIGYASENQEFPEWMRVAEFLDYLRPLYPTWDRDLEQELVRKFDLPGDRKLRHLSRGMRMKAALASSLAYHPRLIVLDEPFGGLDPLVRDELIEGILERAEEATVFISSHDLAEIESFATHVGYLEMGKLRFSEEMSSLTQRFREVELTFDEPPVMPAQFPKTWMHVSSAGTVVRLIESQFDTEKTSAAIGASFGKVKDASFTAMSLRSIFLAMARSPEARKKGAS